MSRYWNNQNYHAMVMLLLSVSLSNLPCYGDVAVVHVPIQFTTLSANIKAYCTTERVTAAAFDPLPQPPSLLLLLPLLYIIEFAKFKFHALIGNLNSRFQSTL